MSIIIGKNSSLNRNFLKTKSFVSWKSITWTPSV